MPNNTKFEWEDTLLKFYLQSVLFTEEGTREDDDIEDDAEGVKHREGEDKLEKRLLEVKCFRPDKEDGQKVTFHMKISSF